MTSLRSLAQGIQQSANVVQDFLDSQNAAESPRFPDNAPEEVLKARNKLINNAQNLHALAQGPAEYLKWQASMAQDLTPIQWIVRHDIASKVPLKGEISYPELAAAAQVDKRILQRILRSAMLTAKLFREDRPDYVSHSPASMVLAADPGIRALLTIEMELIGPSLSRVVDAQQKWNFSTDSTHTGFSLALDYPDRHVYQWFSERPDKRDAIDKAFVEFAQTYGWQPRHLLTSFDFASLSNGSKIVDIGGSRGQNSIYLARELPGLRFVVQDMPEVIATGQEQLPKDLADKIEFQAYDFYTPQPIVDADVYYIQNVFTDQSCENAISVLRNVARGMKKPGAKLILREPVVPAPGTIPLEDELRIRRFDMRAMAIINTGHRTKEEWEDLVEAAGEGLKLVQINRPENSLHSVMVMEIAK